MTTPGAQPWSAPGHGRRQAVGVAVVHGFTANPIGTRPLGQALAAAGFGVEVPCLPGHGTSAGDLATTRYDDWADAVERVLTHLADRHERVAVVGHSMGGTIALDLAARRADLVDALVTINPQVLDRPGALAALGPALSRIVPFLPRTALGLPVDDLARSEVQEHAYRVVSTRAATSLLAQLPRIRRGLYDIDQPILVVRSPQDHTVDPGNALAVMELVGSGDLRELVCERSFHVPQLDHDAPLLEATVVRFLDEVVGARGAGDPGDGDDRPASRRAQA
ncbi:MAG: alpha/beta fold hydrolase [Nitriliruptoraceae bacterium]|nr:alpha/beta fold hydrolase [Nitriliruptoraceae bacterium]